MAVTIHEVLAYTAPGYPPCTEFMVYAGDRLVRTCPSRGMAEASMAAGRHIPLVVENVRGAQPWVGRARWNFGSFYLWGDVPAIMPIAVKATKVPSEEGRRTDPGKGARFTSRDCGVEAGVKQGGDWFGSGDNCSLQRRYSGTKGYVPEGTEALGKHGHPRILPQIVNKTGSGSKARKAASAMIAKIPLPLSRHIAAVYRP